MEDRTWPVDPLHTQPIETQIVSQRSRIVKRMYIVKDLLRKCACWFCANQQRPYISVPLLIFTKQGVLAHRGEARRAKPV
jgi:hypothetical protein